MLRRLYALLACAPLASVADAQGRTDYVNFESPQTEALALARIDGKEYLLACNTPDNSVEIYDTAGNAFIARVPVGTEPVAVEYDAARQVFFTANFIGDSVTRVQLVPAPGGQLDYRVEWTHYVGDEPVDLALDHTGLTLLVAKRTRSSMGWFLASNLAALGGGSFFDARMTDAGLFDDDALVTGAMAVKEPHVIQYDSNPANDRVFVLGHQGGGAPDVLQDGNSHDLDVWIHDFSSGTTSTLGGLGTTNFNMDFASNGDLFVVSTEARNDVQGTANLAALPTGFVRTLLSRIEDPGGPGQVVHPPRDLNTGGLAAGQSLAHATDVVVYEPPVVANKRVFVAGFNSDRVGAIDVSDPDPAAWTIDRVDVVPVDNTVAGPRSLIVKYADAAIPGDPGDRVYVLNRLDNSISAIDPVTLSVTTFALQNDPRPAYQRNGMQFLYSTAFSGNGFVSCASCHIDGRSDQQRWFLTEDPINPPPRIPLPFTPELAGISFPTLDDLIQNGFPSDKEAMVTQSLQGLVNFETSFQAQDYTTNAPYHWRGDKPRFEDFNEAFHNLQGMTDIGSPGDPKGLTEAEMTRYTKFVGSIHYPGNPEQLPNRTYSGDLGDPDDDTDGNGTLWGLKLFHTFRIQESPVVAGMESGRSCVSCHSLPEGSNNRLTVFSGDVANMLAPQPIESAALRGLIQKESRLELDSTVGDTPNDLPITGDWALAHLGNAGRSINDFVRGFREAFIDPTTGLDTQGDAALEALTDFVRKLDWGVSPAAGPSVTVVDGTAGTQPVDDSLDLLEGQVAVANIGLAVYGRIGGTERAWWYRITDDVLGPHYRETGSGSSTLIRDDLLLLLTAPDDVLIFTGTTLGSDRRAASLTGVGEVLSGPAPANIRLEGTTPNTAYASVPTLHKNWAALEPDPDLRFEWLGLLTQPVQLAPEPLSLLATRLLQQGAIAYPELGTVLPNHDAPRRIRVSGDNFLEGCKLTLHIRTSGGPPPGSPGSIGNGTTPGQTPPTFDNLTMPLFPTTDRTIEGRVIWETAVELEPDVVYALLMGGKAAPGVAAAFAGTLTEPAQRSDFDALTWNRYAVTVKNPDGQKTKSALQPFLY